MHTTSSHTSLLPCLSLDSCQVIVQGIPTVERAVIQSTRVTGAGAGGAAEGQLRYELLVEGTGLQVGGSVCVWWGVLSLRVCE